MSRHIATIITVAACALIALALRPPAGATAPPPGPPPWGAIEAPASQQFGSDLPERMARTRRGVAAVALGDRDLGTGFLLAGNLLFTCRHCIQDRTGTRTYDAADLRIRFDTGTDVRPFERYPVQGIVRISEHHDLAVLRLGRDEHGRLPAPDRALRLAKTRTALHTPVYVWSQTAGGRIALADGGYVRFPHRATARELFRIERLLRRELRHPDPVLADLRRGYQASSDGLSELISPIWARQPILGIQARVDHGSSGAPVFDKHTHEVIGMLFAGPDRGPQPAASAWHAHEAVLPAAFLR